jgi:G:T-mismatch repair DNA endonuclease (very short patch repair protein)
MINEIGYADTYFSKAYRSELMRPICGQNTVPGKLVRQPILAHGDRRRLHTSTAKRSRPITSPVEEGEFCVRLFSATPQ